MRQRWPTRPPRPRTEARRGRPTLAGVPTTDRDDPRFALVVSSVRRRRASFVRAMDGTRRGRFRRHKILPSVAHLSWRSTGWPRPCWPTRRAAPQYRHGAAAGPPRLLLVAGAKAPKSTKKTTAESGEGRTRTRREANKPAHTKLKTDQAPNTRIK